MKYLIPLSYLFSSRLKTTHEKISWLIIYPAFLILVCQLYGGNILFLSLAIILTMSVYEIGYLDNDFRTVLSERSPTMRCGDERTSISKNLRKILASRITYAIIIIIFFYLHTEFVNFIKLIVALTILTIGFYFHNTIRSRWNILTYIIIVSCRYVIPILASVCMGCYLLLFITIIFPMVRTVEHSCKDKYDFPAIKRIVADPDIFRVRIYGFIFIISSLIAFRIDDYKFMLLSTYFLVYRIATKYIADKKLANRIQHDSYKWKDK